MKIEIGESLAYSWLKHVKRCQIVQLNWKIADEWQKGNWDKLESIVKEAKEFFTASQENADANEEAEASNIFKKNADLSQIIRQAESDILGIHFDGDGKMEVYAVEVAFHSRGLNYTGGKEATKSKIIAKALRSAMGIYSVLGASQAHLCFMSPKVNPATIETMADVEESLNLFFETFGLDYTFSTYFNNHFSSDVWHPVCQAIANSGANDTSELCARAICLQQLVDENVASEKKHENTKPVIAQAIDREIPIGRLARTVLRNKLQGISLQEAEKFTSLPHSQNVFNLNFPLLKTERVPDHTGLQRYYKEPITIQGHIFYVTSQWYERQRVALTRWLESH